MESMTMRMTTWQPAARLVCVPPVRLRYAASGVGIGANAMAVDANAAAAGATGTAFAARPAALVERAGGERDVRVRPGAFTAAATAATGVAPAAGGLFAITPAGPLATAGHAASARKQHLVRGPSRDPA